MSKKTSEDKRDAHKKFEQRHAAQKQENPNGLFLPKNSFGRLRPMSLQFAPIKQRIIQVFPRKWL